MPELSSLAFVVLVCVLAGFAHGAIGFGFPMVATPLAALAIGIKAAIALLAPVTLVLVVISALRGGPLLDLLRRYWYLPVAMATGAWLGTYLLLALPPEPFILVLALVILMYLNLERFSRGASPLVVRHRVPFGMAFGFAAGITEAVANVAGPLMLVYFMLLGAAPAQIVQTLNLCFSVGKSSQVAAFAAAGGLTPLAWATAAALSVPAVAALAVGMRVRSRIDAETYRRWLRKALWVMVILLLAQFSKSVLAADDDAPLHRAVEQGQLETARKLLADGAPVNVRTANGETPLHLAALHVEADFTDLLLARGADPRAVNKDGETPLHWAALSGHTVVAEHLLARGADPKAKDRKGRTAIDLARAEGHGALVKLLERGGQ